MHQEYRKYIIDQKIDGVCKDSDSLGLVLSNGVEIFIYNNYYISCEDNNIIKRKITDTKERAESLTLFIENGDYISISLEDKDFNGPEAISLTTPDSKIIVWN